MGEQPWWSGQNRDDGSEASVSKYSAEDSGIGEGVKGTGRGGQVWDMSRGQIGGEWQE